MDDCLLQMSCQKKWVHFSMLMFCAVLLISNDVWGCWDRFCSHRGIAGCNRAGLDWNYRQNLRWGGGKEFFRGCCLPRCCSARLILKRSSSDVPARCDLTLSILRWPVAMQMSTESRLFLLKTVVQVTRTPWLVQVLDSLAFIEMVFVNEYGVFPWTVYVPHIITLTGFSFWPLEKMI